MEYVLKLLALDLAHTNLSYNAKYRHDFTFKELLSWIYMSLILLMVIINEDYIEITNLDIVTCKIS